MIEARNWNMELERFYVPQSAIRISDVRFPFTAERKEEIANH